MVQPPRAKSSAACAASLLTLELFSTVSGGRATTDGDADGVPAKDANGDEGDADGAADVRLGAGVVPRASGGGEVTTAGVSFSAGTSTCSATMPRQTRATAT